MQHVRLGFADHPSGIHEASAAAVARVLEAHDLEVEMVALPDGQAAAEAGGAGGTAASGPPGAEGVDLFASAWLEAGQEAHPVAGGMQPLGMLYEPRLLWAMLPGPAAGLDELAGAAGVERRILAEPILLEASRRVIEAYRLGEAGFLVEPASAQDAWRWASDAPAGRIVALHRPHPLLFEGRLRALEDPLGAFGAPRQARLLVRPAARAAFDPDLVDELEALLLDNRVVGAMARAMRMDDMSAEEAADAWQRGRLTPRG